MVPSSPSRPRRALWAALIVVFWLLLGIGAVLAGIGLWVRRTFGTITVDQLISNLPGGGGEGTGGEGLVGVAVVTGLVIPIAAVLAIAVIAECARRQLRRRGGLSGRRTGMLRGIAILLAVLVPLGGGAVLGSTIGAREYVEAVVRETTTGVGLADYYVAPGGDAPVMGAGVHGSARSSSHRGGNDGDADHRNLVVIYLESIEDAMGDAELFGRNMLAPVQEATADWSTIPSLQQYEGGGWTMSGIVATQCGIPLRTANAFTGPAELNELGSEGEEVGEYLGGATCLGDVLAREGYRNVYLGGANAAFAAKGAYLRTHGYDEVHDLAEWQSLGETEIRDDWGLSDRRLFERAREEIVRLHDADQPFNLTMLTVDTHESPWLYDYCSWDEESEAEMTAITFCSMQQVAEFIDFMDEEGILDDTAVVVMGDHRKMIAEGNSYMDELQDRENRTVFNRIWSPDGLEVARDEIDQLSMYPTLLELAGVELPDHRAGIGVSALASRDEVPAGTILDLDAEDYEYIVTSRSAAFYRELWQ